MKPSKRILYVDAYDSFANNIVGLLESHLNAEVTLVRMDNVDIASNLSWVLSSFDAVVVGPGPGHPANSEDVGFIDQLWRLDQKNMIPILGICLGFQSLALAFGAKIKRMKSPRHGIVSSFTHTTSDIFEDLGSLLATQYHSLCADIDHPFQGGTGTVRGIWHCTTTCPELQPLAWGTIDEANGRVLMSLKHTNMPFWGVQFHPESICTTAGGHRLVQNWWIAAQKWSITHGRVTSSRIPPSIIAPHSAPRQANEKTRSSYYLTDLDSKLRFHLPESDTGLLWSSHPLGATDVIDICDAMGLSEHEVILLDSQGHQTGRFSILGLVSQGQGLKLSYTVHDKRLKLATRGQQISDFCLDSIDQVWPLLQNTLDRHAPKDDMIPSKSPFWGGWMGYISYETGLETVNVTTPLPSTHYTPDLNFAFIERSIVLDHHENRLYIQSLIPSDNYWLLETGKLIDSHSGKFGYSADAHDDSGFNRLYQMLDATTTEDAAFARAMQNSYIERPDGSEYRHKVLRCQENLSAGDSYELCLTDETRILIPHTKDISVSPWTIYKHLRKNNPAPFGAYIRLPHTTIVGSSPERFLRWTREGRCQFRPIKGTVKKAPGVDFAAASKILNSSKERAENLMIVDLIRHDLSGVVGAGSCTVPKLMQIEEYKTVWQLVSVVEGQIPDNKPRKGLVSGQSSETEKTSPRGIDVLKASLPPGSMTGAPKKRSCEILADLEKRPRGVYSGVIGYMDVGGGGDFSVVIRTATKWDHDLAMRPPKAAAEPTGDTNGVERDGTSGGNGVHKDPALIPHDVWRIGAGGAVTIQSTADGEFEEMETKLDSVLKTFQV